jgi:hypothetical protein
MFIRLRYSDTELGLRTASNFPFPDVAPIGRFAYVSWRKVTADAAGRGGCRYQFR